MANTIHPFYANGRWTAAGSLKTGDVLLDENGAAQTVQSVETKAEALTAYNLTVADFHTYFVKGAGSGMDAVWVHNACDPADRPDKPDISDETVRWTNNGNRHVPQRKLTWKQIVESTKNGGKAKYHPDVDIEKLERDVWANGTEVSSNNNTRIKIKELDHIAGASEGKETRFVAVKYINGEIHGQPITEQMYRNHYATRINK